MSSGVDGASPRATSAAYQALPVSGALITHNYTPALPVLDADELDKEVRKRRLKWADQPPRRRCRPPQGPRVPALECPKSRRSAERAAAAGGLPPAPLGGRHPARTPRASAHTTRCTPPCVAGAGGPHQQGDFGRVQQERLPSGFHGAGAGERAARDGQKPRSGGRGSTWLRPAARGSQRGHTSPSHADPMRSPSAAACLPALLLRL